MTGQQLRNSILQEAIQGRLVPNVLQPREKTGAELLQDILAERQKKENEEKGKKAKKLTLSIIEEEPWELPEGWCWCVVEDIFNIFDGKRKPVSKENRIGGPYPYYGANGILDYVDKYLFDGEFILVGEDGSVITSNGNPVVNKASGKIWVNNHAHIIRPYDALGYQDFLFYALQGVDIRQYVHGFMPKYSQGDLRKTMIPLPPLSIQKAIVAKIEELLPLVDEYDKAAGELKALNETLPDKFRKSVLQEAIHGNLVPNDIPEGEATAPELLQQILKERQDRENKEKGKKAKKLSLSTIDEDNDELPNGWCWCKLSDIGDCLYGVSESAKTMGKYKLLRITDIQDDNVNWNTVPLSDYNKKDVDNYFLKPCDLVFARTGGTVGKSYLVETVPENSIYASYLIRVRFFGEALLPKYVKYFFQSPQYWSQIIENSEGTGQPNCNGTKLANLNIPLPPLSIQHRIVEKIEELFSAINTL